MTQSQIDAARRNGAKSQGPKTPEGKAISSANSLRHGCCAKAVLLTSENPEAYHKLAEAYYKKFKPGDDVECDLIDEMVIAKWRQRRDWSNEAALFDLEMDRQTEKVDSEYKKIDHASRYALAFRALADESKALQLAARYETTHRRSYYRALTALLELRSAPKPEPDPTPDPAPEPENKSCETNPATANPVPSQQVTNEAPVGQVSRPVLNPEQQAPQPVPGPAQQAPQPVPGPVK